MRKPIRNKRQKAAFKVGERRLAPQEVPELLELSLNPDPADRLHAAENLCPCHVRRSVEAVWQALFRMMEDEDVRVRRAAWHTLEDGGRPDDPRLDAIIERVLASETDQAVRNFIKQVQGEERKQQDTLYKALGTPPVKRKGRCDFCGEYDVFVERDLETMIPTDDLPRAALICESCR
ncbi:MAG: HEAT repeat domain-containing protein [Armatimonadetes bacterium]|nr:HEAT repeat domain-containing protein [Armatimonadota bacterium]